MGFETSVANWTLLYTAELLSFSMILLFLVRSELKWPIIYWIASNILAALAMLTPSTFLETSSNASYSVVSFLFSAASNSLVYLSANYRQSTSLSRIIIFALTVFSWFCAGVLPFGWLSVLIAYTGGTALALVCARAAHMNPLWRGLAGHKAFTAGFIICAALIMWRGLVVFAHREGSGFEVDAADSALGMRMLVFTSFLLQISFISVVIHRDLRRRRIKDRQAAREAVINRDIAEEQREIEAIAQERLDMINLLTHEVRQPINNAQAALEALDTALKGTEEEVNETRGAITRAQGILDGITLSISNAILGVLLIDDEHQIQPRPVDAVEVADLARSDCPAEQRHRIHISSSTDPIFADLDPVLIRLALRNLLDNALKYSQPNSLVQIDIAHDDERLGVSFKVTNKIAAPTVLSNDIFRHRVRANASPVEGSGHGLFLVKKVADAHHGKISFSESDGARVTFDLFIPT